MTLGSCIEKTKYLIKELCLYQKLNFIFIIKDILMRFSKNLYHIETSTPY